jgi:hypothetical protein
MFGLVLTLLLACSEPLPEMETPWTEFRLPANGATVEQSSDTEIIFLHGDADKRELTNNYVQRLQINGWAFDEPMAIKGMYMGQGRKGEQQITVLVSKKGGEARVHLMLK